MVRVISQETYDETVKENIAEFSMTPEEAIQDAIEQFNAQLNKNFLIVEMLCLLMYFYLQIIISFNFFIGC